ncbi:threonine-phosphate decarboxylase CobD [Bacillus sp. DTU_2020_1000418_1_SI_GHA_SEK_038]|uniref:threonine-phosphate decarboxylase CobD n=1 Tax=Bacillus sp. DTU_2020_1000418_1_SI_GHA_SEK_038 TaxID=3077585 RepID=UPI0028EEB443|nr:threonine-phosphate decarboxylase CobD [Bacillus sp. DTU_2020_1000418_1_SI_GHA_SEK_038]WNS75911.1 threonine-phosphate decarboxylase CobD [Bacillus sp. DTU_2020_1000418_1_SI_GHA_SEK_038]
MNWPVHGSNPQYLFASLNMAMPHHMIDFSANINPLGPPPILKEKWAELFSVIADYPDPKGHRFKKKLAEKEKLSERQILIGNGGAELISLIGRMLAGKRVLIVQPAFSEYEEACRINSCTIDYHQLSPEKWELNVEELAEKLPNTDALFICNPCNPTGVYYSKSNLIALMNECQKQDCLFIVDEAFYDFLSEYESIVSCINEYSNLIIIRSMTKMFAIPGLRLGYLMANQTIIDYLASLQPHWSMNALALQAGEWCLDSESYVWETRELINKERKRLFDFYRQKDLMLSPSRVNFYLLRDPVVHDQFSLFQFLLSKGIIPRHTMNFPGIEGEWLRFAIKGPKENDKLMGAIEEWRNRP